MAGAERQFVFGGAPMVECIAFRPAMVKPEIIGPGPDDVEHGLDSVTIETNAVIAMKVVHEVLPKIRPASISLCTLAFLPVLI